MNLPKSMTAKSYQKTASSLLKATLKKTEESMKDAANEMLSI